MRIVINIDQKAALLAGRELGQTAEIEIKKSDVENDADWTSIVESLDMSKSPATSNLPAVDDATVAAYIGMVAARRAEQEAKAQKQEAEILEYIRLAAEYVHACETAPLMPCKIYPQGVEIMGVTSHDMPVRSPSRPWPCNDNRVEVAFASMVAADAARKARAEKENEKLIAAAQPQIDAELAKKAAVEAEQEAAEQAAKKAKYAARLASGIYERETSSYNERRYGRPWIAAVRLTGTKLEYDFAAGTVTASFGSAGMLSIPCVPGDVIAYGQKDNRRPDKSDHTILRMRDDGSMETIDRTDAVRYLRAK